MLNASNEINVKKEGRKKTQLVHRVCLVVPKNDWTNITQEMEQMGRRYFVLR
ncbi:MAG: hypothetical protein LBU56_03955 [Rickettsiales bacterium]|nr:hypothetical protein [Rickettsiales bacterium]